MLRVVIIWFLSITLVSGEHFYLEAGTTVFGRSSFSRNNTQQIIERYNVGLIQFLLITQRVSWYEADVICTSYNATLASFDDQEVIQNFANALARTTAPVGDAWIGARFIKSKWLWKNGKDVSSKLLKEELIIGKACLLLKFEKDLVLTPAECSSRKRFVCQKDIIAALEDDEVPRPSPKIVYKDREYVLYTNPLSFYAAAAFCAFKGTRLAVLDDINVTKKISRLMIIHRPSSDRVWTAGRYFDDAWRWLPTGDPIEKMNKHTVYYTYISTNHTTPQHRCILLEQELYDDPIYTAVHCHRKFGFVCEKAPPENPTLTRSSIKSRFVIVDEKLAWVDANDYCKNLGGYLAEISDAEELKAAVDLMAKRLFPPHHLWLGGQLQNQSWVWQESKTSVKSDADFQWCQCTERLHEPCLTLERLGDNKSLLHGLPCDYEQMFACSNIDG